jgi:hypothetical protein
MKAKIARPMGIASLIFTPNPPSTMYINFIIQKPWYSSLYRPYPTDFHDYPPIVTKKAFKISSVFLLFANTHAKRKEELHLKLLPL